MRKNMIIAVDIGNTTIGLGLMQGSRIIKSYSIPTHQEKSRLQKHLSAILRQVGKKLKTVEAVIICSVVPDALRSVERFFKRSIKLKVKVIGKDLKVPIMNKYKNPNQVGQDRLICAYAALNLYKAPLIVVDLGTAITLDIVSKRKEYLGGIIVPGIKLSVESLYQKAALLPRITIKDPPALIGQDTEGSILSGIFHGYGALITGLIAQIKRKIQGNPKVIVTGGHVHIMKRFIKGSIDHIDTYLAFRGMSQVWDDLKK